MKNRAKALCGKQSVYLFELSFILAGLIFSTCAYAALSEAITAQIDALFSHLEEGRQPGAAVMVIRDGAVVHARGYGLADLESQAQITQESVFRLGSVSKMFTAMAIAILADRGKLDLDQPAADFVSVLAAHQGVTIRHLLTHTSGLPDYYDEFDSTPWVEQGRIPSNADSVAYLGKMGFVLFEPGERYEYSNPGYEVLPLVIEAVSGKPFRAFMHEEVFGPAGMDHSTVHDHTRPRITPRALGYSPEGSGFVLDDDDPLNGLTGSGSQFSTLEDFQAWDRAIANGLLLSDPMQAQVFTRAKLNSGEKIDYGFGWRLDEYRGHPRTMHSGSWIGFRSAFSRYPDDGLTIVILANRSDFEAPEASERVADLFLP